MMRIMNLAFALILFIGSAGVTAFLTTMFIQYGLGVSPAVLRVNALISAGAIGVVLLVAVAGVHESED
jgi:hypothetical protein